MGVRLEDSEDRANKLVRAAELTSTQTCFDFFVLRA